jgi:hypothetical protein
VGKLSTDLKQTSIALHPRENRSATGPLGALNAEIVTICDGCSSFALDLRGTFSLTVEVSGTVDGTNWIPIPMLPVNQASRVYVAAVTGTVQGLWEGKCAPYTSIRARVSAFTSGAATATLSASNGLLDDNFRAMTSLLVTQTAAAGAAATLTLPSPGAGLRQYMTYLSINRFASALLTAAATPVIVTTTNLPGSLAFSFPADAATQGSLFPWREDLAYPLAASAQATATTVVAPATPNVIWRMTAGYYVAP